LERTAEREMRRELDVVQPGAPDEITALLIFMGFALITALSSGSLSDREHRLKARQTRLVTVVTDLPAAARGRSRGLRSVA